MPVSPVNQEVIVDDKNNIDADKLLVEASKRLERNHIRFDDPD